MNSWSSGTGGDFAAVALGVVVAAAVACGSPPSPPFEPGWRFSQNYWGPTLPEVDPRDNPIPTTNAGGGMMPPIEIRTNNDGTADVRANPQSVNQTAVTVTVTYEDGTTEDSGDNEDAAWTPVHVSEGHGGIASITFELGPASTLKKTVKFDDPGWTH